MALQQWINPPTSAQPRPVKSALVYLTPPPPPREKHTLQIRTVKDLPDQTLASETHDSQLNSQTPSPSILNPDTHVLITKATQKQQNNTVVRSTSKTIGM